MNIAYRLSITFVALGLVALVCLALIVAFDDVKKAERRLWCKRYHDRIQFEECMTEGASYVEK